MVYKYPISFVWSLAVNFVVVFFSSFTTGAAWPGVPEALASAGTELGTFLFTGGAPSRPSSPGGHWSFFFSKMLKQSDIFFWAERQTER